MSQSQTVAKKKPRKQAGYMVRLPNDMKGPLEARSKATGRTVTTELVIAVVKHLIEEPEGSPKLRLPPDIPTGHTPPEEPDDE